MKKKGRPNKTRHTICFLIHNQIREIYDISSYKKLEESIKKNNNRKELEEGLNQPERESIFSINFENGNNPHEDDYDDLFDYEINIDNDYFQF